MTGFILLALAAQVQLPPPVGYVNDFAGVVTPGAERVMLAVIDEVRAKSGGEIVVVTLPDLAGRPSIEVARDIGRQWRVGAQGGAGDRARNAGVILLLKPGNRPGDGLADLAIATGSGTEGFITDARSGRIRDALGQVAVERGNYADGLVAAVWLLGQAYADEFGFELTGEPPIQEPGGSIPGSALVPLAVLLFFLLPLVLRVAFRGAGYRRRFRGGPSGLEWIVLGTLLGGRRGGSGRGGWGGWGGGGFGGGGFGGFGGGGGFSGGGASGRF